MSNRNNKPIWLIFALIILGVLVAVLARIIYFDVQIDVSSRQKTSEISSNF